MTTPIEDWKQVYGWMHESQTDNEHKCWRAVAKSVRIAAAWQRRAEAAEARAAAEELRTRSWHDSAMTLADQRDAAWGELRGIRDEVTRKLYRLSKDAYDAETQLAGAAYVAKAQTVTEQRTIAEFRAERNAADTLWHEAEALAETRLEEIIRLKHELAAAELHISNAAQVVVTLTKERNDWKLNAQCAHIDRDAALLCTESLQSTLKTLDKDNDNLRRERDAARLELQQIRTMLDDGTDDDATALDMVKRVNTALYDVRRELKALKLALAETFNSGDGVYRP